MSEYAMALERLTQHGQAHVLKFWKQLNERQQQALLSQVAQLDFASITRMQTMLAARGAPAEAGEVVPAPVVEPEAPARAAARERGVAALRAGRVGVVLVAGGQGSRLGFEGPKGAFPIGPVSEAPLFYFHVRKVLALSRAHGVRLPLYIMTSEANDAATRACFDAHGWFGLDPADVFFFTQGMWPALDPEGRILLEAPDRLFLSPDGHGGTLSALAASGALADMERRGLKTIFYFQVDNPLVEVADPIFLGVHLTHGADVSLKVCAKRDPQEGLGVVVVRDGRCAMVEYTELTTAQKHQRDAAGELHFKFGSVAIHLFSLPFLRQEAQRPLPLHLAFKKIACCDPDGRTVVPTAPNGYKFEKFIFDVLPDARVVVNLAFDRREEFSPVKNAMGADSPATCRRDLSAKWARWLRAAGMEVPLDAEGCPTVPVEIDPAFANSAEELAHRQLAGLALNRPIRLVDEPS